MLLVIVPGLIYTYNYLEFTITGIGALIILLVVCISITYFVMKMPDIKLKKLGRLNISTILAKGLAALLIVFILQPIITLITSEDLATLSKFLSDSTVMNAIWLSISMAFLATLISLFMGIPLGYLLARHDFHGRSVIQGIVDVPVVIPHTVAGIALLIVFGANGVIGAPLNEMGVRFVDAWPGIVIAMLFVSVPFVINSARDGFSAIDPRLEFVARSLGATRTQAFSKVALRLSLRPIVTGAIMSWARAISEFGAVVILVYFPMIAPTLIYDRFTSFGLAGSRPIAIILVLICLVVFIALRLITGTYSTNKVPRRV
jgi:molybdate/tungstate transport system permease protein